MRTMRTTATAVIFAALMGCTSSEQPRMPDTETRAAHRTETNDTTATTPGISFDMGDTAMEDDEEIINFTSEEWDEVGMDADL